LQACTPSGHAAARSEAVQVGELRRYGEDARQYDFVQVLCGGIVLSSEGLCPVLPEGFGGAWRCRVARGAISKVTQLSCGAAAWR
jgi:hypothetical protein